jgi:hypothetical protein
MRCLDLKPRGYSEEEKDLAYWACRERGSKRAISRIFGTGRCCLEPVALGRPVPTGPTGHGDRTWGPFGKDLRAAQEPDSTKPRLKEYRQGRNFSDFWKSSEATASEAAASPGVCVQPQPPVGRKVQWRAGPRASAFSVGFGRSWPDRSSGREQPPSQNERVI